MAPLTEIGLRALQSGRFDEAVTVLSQAVRAAPADVTARFALGFALQKLGRLSEAVSAYEAVLAVAPDHADTLNNLAAALSGLGRFRAATAVLERLCAMRPEDALPIFGLGTARLALGHIAAARDAFDQARRCDPDMHEAWLKAAECRAMSGDLDGADAVLRAFVDRHPDAVAGHVNLGVVCLRRGRHDAALGAFRAALSLAPDFAHGHLNLGLALAASGDRKAAHAAFAQAWQHDPDLVAAPARWAASLLAAGELAAAERVLLGALAAHPDAPELLRERAKLARERGALADAAADLERVLVLAPDDVRSHSDLINLTAIADSDDHRLQRQLAAFDARFPTPPRIAARISSGRLRVGFLSADFCDHVAMRAFLPLLGQLDRTRLEVFCYGAVSNPDSVTEAVMRGADHWCSVLGQTDLAAARRLSGDRLDLLVDLDWHTAGHRLDVMARRPAPVQASWLHAIASTGLSAVDHWIVDPVLVPEDSREPGAARAWRLDRCFVAYVPDADAPPPQPRPAGAPLVLGCFNHAWKVGPQVVALWAEIMRARPDARLLLKAWQLADRRVAADLRASFAAHRVDPSRLEFAAWLPRGQHWTAYDQVDILLDPFPFTGGMTTQEALSRGVPVVSLAGRRASARLGASILTHAGCGDWVAGDRSGYVQTVLTLADDLAALRARRAGLRRRVLASNLCDVAGLARALESCWADMVGTSHGDN